MMEFIVDLKFMYQDPSTEKAVLEFDLMDRVAGPDVGLCYTFLLSTLIATEKRLFLNRHDALTTAGAYKPLKIICTLLKQGIKEKKPRMSMFSTDSATIQESNRKMFISCNVHSILISGVPVAPVKTKINSLSVTRAILSQSESNTAIFNFQNRNIKYIMEATRAQVIVRASWSGTRNGLSIIIRHETINGIINSEFLLYKLLEWVCEN